jgi:hypothetical protein
MALSLLSKQNVYYKMELLTKNLEGLILDLLLVEGSLTTKDLIEKLSRKHPCTKQGVYRALRKLRSEEKIVTHQSLVSVNNFWREQMQSLLRLHDAGSSVIGDVRELRKGDKLSLKLRGLSTTDQVWSHLFVGLEKELPSRYPLFLYNPHNWLSLLREETDRIHAQRLEQNHRPTYLIVGSSGDLDKAVTQAMKFKYFEYSFNARIHQPDYMAIIADYVFQLKLLGDGNSHIHSIFSTENDVLSAKNLLVKLDKKIACRIVIEKNPAKALLWKKRIGKDFYIPKKYASFS